MSPTVVFEFPLETKIAIKLVNLLNIIFVLAFSAVFFAYMCTRGGQRTMEIQNQTCRFPLSIARGNTGVNHVRSKFTISWGSKAAYEKLKLYV